MNAAVSLHVIRSAARRGDAKRLDAYITNEPRTLDLFTRVIPDLCECAARSDKFPKIAPVILPHVRAWDARVSTPKDRAYIQTLIRVVNVASETRSLSRNTITYVLNVVKAMSETESAQSTILRRHLVRAMRQFAINAAQQPNMVKAQWMLDHLRSADPFVRDLADAAELRRFDSSVFKIDSLDTWTVEKS